MDAFRLAPPMHVSGIEREIDTKDLEQQARVLRQRITRLNQQILDVGRMRDARAQATEEQLQRARAKLADVVAELERLDRQFAALPGVGRFLRVVQETSLKATDASLRRLEHNLRLLPSPFAQNDPRPRERLVRVNAFLAENIAAIEVTFDNTIQVFRGQNGPTLQAIAENVNLADERREEAARWLRIRELTLRMNTDIGQGRPPALSKKEVLLFLREIQRAAPGSFAVELLAEAAEHARALADAQVARDAGDAIRAAAFLHDLVRTFARVALPPNLEERLLAGSLSVDESDRLRDLLTTVLEGVQQGAFDLLFGGNRVGELRASLARTAAAIREGHRGISVGVDDDARNATQAQLLAALDEVRGSLLTWTASLDRLHESAPSLDELQRWFRERSRVHPDTLRSVTVRAEQLERVRRETIRTMRNIADRRDAIVGEAGNAIRDAVDGLGFTRSLLIRAHQETAEQILDIRAEGRQIPMMRVQAGRTLRLEMRIRGGTPPYTLTLAPVRDLDADFVAQLHAEANGVTDDDKLRDPEPEYRAASRAQLSQFHVLHADEVGGAAHILAVDDSVTLNRAGTLKVQLAPVEDWHTGTWTLQVWDSGVREELTPAIQVELRRVRNDFLQAFFDAVQANQLGALGLTQQARNTLRDDIADAAIRRGIVGREHLGIFANTDVPVTLSDQGDVIRWLNGLAGAFSRAQIDSQRFDLVVIAKQPCIRCGERFSQLWNNDHGACEWSLAPTAYEYDLITRRRAYTPAGKERDAALEKHPAIREQNYLLSVVHKAFADLHAPGALRTIARERMLTQQFDANGLEELRHTDAFCRVLSARVRLNKAREKLILLRDIPRFPIAEELLDDERVFLDKINAEKRRNGQRGSKSLRRLVAAKNRDDALDQLWSEEANYVQRFDEHVAMVQAARTPFHDQVRGGGKQLPTWRGRHSVSSRLPTPPTEFRPERRASQSLQSGFNYRVFTPGRLFPGQPFTNDERLFMQASQFIGLQLEGRGILHAGQTLHRTKLDKWAWARADPDTAHTDDDTRTLAVTILHKQLNVVRDTDYHFRGLGRNTFTLKRVSTINVNLNMLDLDSRDPEYAQYVEQSILTAESWRAYNISHVQVRTFKRLQDLGRLVRTAPAISIALRAVALSIARILRAPNVISTTLNEFAIRIPPPPAGDVHSAEDRAFAKNIVMRMQRLWKGLVSGKQSEMANVRAVSDNRRLLANIRQKPVKKIPVGLWRGGLDHKTVAKEAFSTAIDLDTESDDGDGDSDTTQTVDVSDDDFPFLQPISGKHSNNTVEQTVTSALAFDESSSGDEKNDSYSMSSDEGDITDSPFAMKASEARTQKAVLVQDDKGKEEEEPQSATSSDGSCSDDTNTDSGDLHGLSTPFATVKNSPGSHGLASPFTKTTVHTSQETIAAAIARDVARKALASSKAYLATKAAQFRLAKKTHDTQAQAERAAAVAENVVQAEQVAEKAERIGAQTARSTEKWNKARRDTTDVVMGIFDEFENNSVTEDSLQTWMSNVASQTRRMHETDLEIREETSEQLRALHSLKNKSV